MLLRAEEHGGYCFPMFPPSKGFVHSVMPQMAGNQGAVLFVDPTPNDRDGDCLMYFTAASDFRIAAASDG